MSNIKNKIKDINIILLEIPILLPLKQYSSMCKYAIILTVLCIVKISLSAVNFSFCFFKLDHKSQKNLFFQTIVNCSQFNYQDNENVLKMTMEVPPIRIYTKTILYYPVNFTVLQELKKVNVILSWNISKIHWILEFPSFQMKVQVVMKTNYNNYKTLLNVTIDLCNFSKQIDGNILLRMMVGYQMQKIKIQCPLKKVK